MEILIRPWRKEDFPAVRRILWESWIAAYRAFIPEEDLRAYFEATYQIDSLARLYDNPRVHGFIGEADGEAVGFARTQFHKQREPPLPRLALPPARLSGKGDRRGPSTGGRGERPGVRPPGALGRGDGPKRGGPPLVRQAGLPVRQGGALSDGADHRGPSDRMQGDYGTRSGMPHCGGGSPPSIPGKAIRLPCSRRQPGLLARQKEKWPGLAEGYAALEALRVREIRGGRWGVKVQFNPRRIVSSGARVDPESIRSAPLLPLPRTSPPGATGDPLPGNLSRSVQPRSDLSGALDHRPPPPPSPIAPG